MVGIAHLSARSPSISHRLPRHSLIRGGYFLTDVDGRRRPQFNEPGWLGAWRRHVGRHRYRGIGIRRSRGRARCEPTKRRH